MTRGKTEKDLQHYCRQMTVANIRYLADADYDEVLFLESARFYRLIKLHSDYGSMLEKLRKAHADGAAVEVCFSSVEDDCIEAVL
jgi:hypothetical protein